MEEKLRAYMEQLFRDVPDSEQAREIKEEILQNITDKYHDLLAEGKSEEAAYNIAIEGIGDLNELLDSLKQNASGDTTGETASSFKTGSEREPDGTPESNSVYHAEYMEWKKKSAVRTAVAVMLYILSIVPPIIASELAHDDVIGPCMMFFIIAVATAILVFNNMSKPAYTKKGETVADEFMEWKHKTDVRKQSWRSINSALWSVVLVLYFVISFTTMAWHVTWVIFLLGAAAQSILKAIMLNRNDAAGSRTIQIVCGIIAGAALLIAVVFLGGHFLTKGFSLPSLNFSIFGGTHYSNAEKYKAGNVTIQPDSGTENALSEIRVDWIDGTVEVSSVDGLKEIKIEEEGSADMSEEDRVHSYYHNGILEIQYRESGWHFFKSSPANKHLKVEIPVELAKGIKSIDGDFVSSDVTIQNLRTDSLLLDTVSGEMKFTGSARKEIDYDCVSGEGIFHLTDAPEELSTDSVSADITVVLPETASFEAKLDTVSGKLSCELPTNNQEKEDGNYYISCGDGGNEFDFDSVSGDVNIQADKSHTLF